jgi:hypothetical protein
LPAKSHFEPAANERNLLLARQIIGQQEYRMPWGNDRELRQFRSEMESAMRDGPNRFLLHGEASGFAGTSSRYGLLNRLLRSSHGSRMI